MNEDQEPEDEETPEERAAKLVKKLRIGSRWNYVAAGVSGFMAVLFAIGGNLPFGLLQLFFCYWNWNVAEDKRKEELTEAANLPKEKPTDSE